MTTTTNSVEQRQQSSFFASNNVIQTILESSIHPESNGYLRRYRSLRFGPQVPYGFDIYAGDGLYNNSQPCLTRHPEWHPGYYDYMPGSSGHSIATSSRNMDEMTSGKHYISFNFQNLGTRDETDVQIGVMRRIELRHWERTILPEYKEECYLRNAQLRSILRRMRRQTGLLLQDSLGRDDDPGNVDCCLFNPRGIWTDIPTPPNGPIMPGTTCNAFISKNKWDGNSLTYKKNLRVAYNTATLDYEAGLLLDSDRGTLDYYHKGMFITTLANDLAGGYVWVMQFECKKSNRHTKIKTYTY